MNRHAGLKGLAGLLDKHRLLHYVANVVARLLRHHTRRNRSHAGIAQKPAPNATFNVAPAM